ncbi:zinc finger, C2H2-type transcription factor [Pseudohyphozyma bogoriensis]|nr:zinc finger, C2H2-type transcription factor [Pseudohyphozyma bogoriensis]
MASATATPAPESGPNGKATVSRGRGKRVFEDDEPKFKCPDCDKVFSRNEYVKRHRRLAHLGVRPFSCDACGNSFARSDLLKRHRKICPVLAAPSPPPPEIPCATPGANAFDPEVLGLGAIFPHPSFDITVPDHPSASSGSSDADLEYTEEARLLADYFNKGGIGGITALDLGFSYEPSLYPAELLETTERAYRDPTDNFFMPQEKYGGGYISPLTVQLPTLDTMSSYAEVASTKFLPHVPVVHPGTLSMSSIHPVTGSSLAIAGSVMVDEKDQVGMRYYGVEEVKGSAESNLFGDQVLLEKRVHLIGAYSSLFKTFEDRFAALQSMLLYQLLGLFHVNSQQRHLSRTLHGSLVMMFRNLKLLDVIRETKGPSIHAGLAGAELDSIWREWIKVETWRRVTFSIFLADLESTIFSPTPSAPLITLSSLSIPLPSSDALWNSPTALSWLKLYLISPPPIPFLETINALLEDNTPSSRSPSGVLLGQLATAGSFPLLILSRTLKYLEESLEAGQLFERGTSLDALKSLEEAAQKEKEFRRIRKGRERLEKTPGGASRGGGEGWYEGIKPVVDQTDAVIDRNGLTAIYAKTPAMGAEEMRLRAEGVGRVW